MALENIVDVDVPRSPGWWLTRLAVQLHDRRRGAAGRQRFHRDGIQSSRVRPGLELLDDYLRGDPPLRQDIHSDWARPFRQYLRMGRMNIAPLLVSSTSSRLKVRDFRTSAGDDDLGDVEARKIMRANKYGPKMRDTHDNALGHGDGYMLITAPDSTRSYSLATAESALQCITAEDPVTGRTLASLKMFRDEHADTDWAYLFLTDDPDAADGELFVARADVGYSTLFHARGFALSQQWKWDTDLFDTIPGTRNPMVRFENKNGRSELEGYLDTLDRINDKLFNEWWIGKIQAFRQRALIMADQADADEDDELAEQLDELISRTPDVESMSESEISSMFTTAPDGFWTLPMGAKLWESTPTDFRQLTQSIKAELEWLAAAKSMPLHTITPDAANGSAEGASTMKEEHIFIVEDRADRFGPAHELAMSLCFEYQGDNDRADVTQVEAIWAPFERYSLEQKSQAASQVAGILPAEIIMQDYLQMSPADIVERVRPARARDALYAAMATPPAAARPATTTP